MDKKNFVVEYTISGYPEDATNIMSRLIRSRLKEHLDYIDNNIILSTSTAPTWVKVTVFPDKLKAEIPAFLKDHVAFKMWWDVTLNTVNAVFNAPEGSVAIIYNEEEKNDETQNTD